MTCPSLCRLCAGMRSAALLLAAPTLLHAGAGADGERTPTFVDDVAPIVYENCVTCHRSDGVGPFPLITYPHVRKRARQIAVVTETGYMPPWKPEPGFGEFQNARVLDEGEKEILRAWAEAGAPAGDMERLPPPPEFEEGWVLGPPDLVLEMEEPYVVPAEGRDVYRSLLMSESVEEGHWVRGIHFLPDNRKPVHHSVVLLDPTGVGRELDAADPDVGYEGMVSEEILFGNEVYLFGPGTMPMMMRDGVAWWLPPGVDFILSTHFQVLGKPEPVKIRLGLYFADRPPSRPSIYLPIHAGPICIPPGVSDYEVWQEYVIPVPVDLVSIQPHAHYICRENTVVAELPTGEVLDLIRISDWDIAWQDDYQYVEPIPLPAGTRVRMQFVYDNSAANDRNPFHPPRRVLSGPRSIDEMLLLWLHVTVDAENLGRLKEDVTTAYGEMTERATAYEALYDGLVGVFDENGDETLDPGEDARATAYLEQLPTLPQAKAFDMDGNGEMDEVERDFQAGIVRIWKGEPVDFVGEGLPALPPSAREPE